jgi:hypothetical protein
MLNMIQHRLINWTIPNDDYKQHASRESVNFNIHAHGIAWLSISNEANSSTIIAIKYKTNIQLLSFVDKKRNREEYSMI